MSGNYHISTLWITRQSSDTPELVVAWDHITIDENPGGFTEACEKELGVIGDDVRDKAFITLIVPEDPIFAALYPEDVEVKVVAVGHEDHHPL